MLRSVLTPLTISDYLLSQRLKIIQTPRNSYKTL